MSIRAAFSTILVSLAVGCAATPDDGSEGASVGAEQAVKNRICPTVWAPVCGKDGKTYSNTCEAGGPGRVAYEGECIDQCAAVLCIEGTVCKVRGNKPVCVKAEDPTSDPCAAVRCAAGTYCDSSSGTAECVAEPIDPCATVRCAAGYHCEAVQVQCIMAPCDPIAMCVAD